MRIPLETTQSYLKSGLCVLPARRLDKCPAVKSWKAYQDRLPTKAEVDAWFANEHDAVCIVTGKASGNLEIIDFDNGGELFGAWSSLVEETASGLLDRLVIEQTPSGGWHVVYRCEAEVSGNLKLAQGQRNGKLTTLIETRGNGGLFLCAPTAKYELVQGAFTVLPTLTGDEREALLAGAWQLNEHWEPVESAPEIIPSQSGSGKRPGDDYNERGDVKNLLLVNGWRHIHTANGNEYFRRPGKNSGSWSASLKDRVFYVFSSNAAPFEANQAYAPFAVYAELEHQGDFAAAAKALTAQGFGDPAPEPDNRDVDVSAIVTPSKEIIIPPSSPRNLRTLLEQYPTLRKPIIHGLLREGETLNVIAPAKTGKSWLVIDLTIAVCTGLPWLGMPCEPGNVLILDNELHGETSANRIPKVADARNVRLSLLYDRIFIDNLRGRLLDILSLNKYFEQFKPEQFKVIILDAFYRFLPAGTDENDNGAMANIYNRIDHYADLLKCSFVLIHHTSKGNQSMKSVTDVGAGAGTQARATDSHFVLRNHEEPGVVVVEAVVRSWPPLAPYCLRWNFPVWMPDRELDPALFLGMRQERTVSPRKDMEPGEFTTMFFHENPISKARTFELASLAGLTQQRIRQLLQLAVESGLLYRWIMPDKTVGFATEPPPEDESAKIKIIAEIIKNPGMSSVEIANRTGVSKRWVRKIRSQMGYENI